MNKKNYRKRIGIYLLFLFVFLFGGATMYAIVYFFPPNDGGNHILRPNRESHIVERGSLAASVEKAYDAVVMIQGFNNNVQTSTGTGFIYKVDGNYAYIMTNEHVVSGGDRIGIITSTDDEIDAEILGMDEFLDLAVLRIDVEYANGIAKIGDSTESSVGDIVFTIGSPLGFDYRGSVTSGILSGRDRMVTVSVGGSRTGDWVMRVLQTDAAINPGNSGGPLLNVNGEVIGINSMKLVQAEIEGMGFAIPIEYAMTHIESLERGEIIERPVLGIAMVNVREATVLQRNNYNIPADLTDGVIVVGITENTGAHRSDLEEGDVIIALNGEEIRNLAYLRFELFKYHIGDTIELTVLRDGRQRSTRVELTRSSD